MAREEVLENNIDFYEEYYSKPAWWFKLRYDTQYKVKTAVYALKKAGLIKPNKDIFEIGYGSGELLFKFPTSNGIFGAEISTYAVKNANAKAKKLGYVRSNFEGLEDDSKDPLPFKNEKFDVIIASHTLEHIADVDGFISNVKKRLKPNGHVLILVPINEKYDDPKHVHHFTSGTCIAEFTTRGFNCVLNFENEYLFHLVEDFYIGKLDQSTWTAFEKIKRVMFNFSFALLPYFAFMRIDSFLHKALKWKPRQAVMVFQMK